MYSPPPCVECIDQIKRSIGSVTRLRSQKNGKKVRVPWSQRFHFSFALFGGGRGGGRLFLQLSANVLLY